MPSTRRQFIQSSLIAAASAMLPLNLLAAKQKPLLSFSTLGCPDWDFKKIVDFAAKYGFAGVLVEGWNQGWDGNWLANGDKFNFTKATPDFDLAEVEPAPLASSVPWKEKFLPPREPFPEYLPCLVVLMVTGPERPNSTPDDSKNNPL